MNTYLKLVKVGHLSYGIVSKQQREDAATVYHLEPQMTTATDL